MPSARPQPATNAARGAHPRIAGNSTTVADRAPAVSSITRRSIAQPKPPVADAVLERLDETSS